MERVLSIISKAEKAAETEFESTVKEGLVKYFTYLLDYNKNVNLISRKSEDEVLLNALIESCDLYEVINCFEGEFLDVGSGGGLPGMIIAVMMRDVKIFLLDATRKKAVFLDSAAKETGLDNVTVINSRLEDLPSSKKYDVVFSRGVGNFETLRKHYLRVLSGTGSLVVLSGDDNRKFFKNDHIFENPYLPGRIIAVVEK